MSTGCCRASSTSGVDTDLEPGTWVATSCPNGGEPLDERRPADTVAVLHELHVGRFVVDVRGGPLATAESLNCKPDLTVPGHNERHIRVHTISFVAV